MLQSSLRKNPVKREHFVKFMERILTSGHAEVVPPVADDSEVWYLLLFGVYHPKKVDQIRVVFDSSCKYEGISLNNVLMQGPDLMNRLDGVLLRFRKETVAVVADIQQMFFGFYVDECHRDYLRFFWHADNDVDQPLIEYRMCEHVFGNSPSPAVATYGLRRCVEDCGNPCDVDLQEFVTRNFYVDDGLMSFPTVTEAVDVLKKAQRALLEGGNLKLHKIASSSEEVMSQFPAADLAKTLEPLDLTHDELPLHHSLGMAWELSTDTFTYNTSENQKPFTKRGLLSTVNGIFDPLGFLAPIIIRGKIIMRDAVNEANGWDDPLLPHTEKVWRSWTEQLSKLCDIHIPRCFLTVSFSKCVTRTLHIFSDASELAVAACAFLRGVNEDGEVFTGFVFGKSKVAPKHGHTIPRLELCAAVLATEIGEMLSEQLDIPLDHLRYYTDSRIVLGYLSNERRRFYVYVSNRVARIRKISSPTQWQYVPTEENPADEGTRGFSPEQFADSLWFNGPSFLRNHISPDLDVEYSLVEPESDKEVRPDVHSWKTNIRTTLGTSRFNRFSSWNSLVRAIRTIRVRLRSRFNIQNDLTRREVELFVIKELQMTYFSKEIQALRSSKSLPKDSSVLCLNPHLDEKGLLRVGGRINRGDFHETEKNPILIPGRSHIAKLLVQHHHLQVQHQGRHMTEGAIRNAGLWVTGAKRLIASTIHHCVTCRRLRGKFSSQKMSDLPVDHLTPSPPFTLVGVDVFGPWNIITRRTRGGNASSKRWAVLFTCLYSRAVHIEIIPEMTSSSFINAMRRFIAVRGEVSEFRSDCGSNFVGAVNELGIHSINVGDPQVKTYLDTNNMIWRFNLPHASHFG
ncbi:uncharacterized protein LOC132557875 [Ylistrum balloti]|uniref:uncharacterized protein LOC132557875 n=1 Tax=Ylistrum balloti TaxID=509963 RepID=UPI002905CF69|nr:uncharacterized protein LOC132557875 [Ylistrum balloti]